MEVFTEAWCAACCAGLNQRESYRTAAAGWEGAAVLVMSADPEHGGGDRAVWLDVHHGRCRGARVATETDLATATYVFRADPVHWERMLAGALDPVAAVMQGKLRLTRGNLFALARYAAAAREMVLAAGEVGGTFPPSAG